MSLNTLWRIAVRRLRVAVSTRFLLNGRLPGRVHSTLHKWLATVGSVSEHKDEKLCNE